MKKHDDGVPVITSAPAEPSVMGPRERRYLISMAIRTVCFVGACLTDGPLRWILVVGAVILPYVSVVLANAGVRLRAGSGTEFVPMERDALPAGHDRDAL